MIWLGTNSASPQPLKSGPHHEYCLPTAHLPLIHPRVSEVVFIQPFLGSVSYCTFLYVECWAIPRDQLTTNTSSEGHCCISAAQTLLLLYLQFHSQSCIRSLCLHLLSLSQHLCWSLDLSDLAVFLLHWFFTCSLKDTHIHTHTRSASNNASLELSCLLQGSHLKGLLSGSVSLKPISSSLHRRYSS